MSPPHPSPGRGQLQPGVLQLVHFSPPVLHSLLPQGLLELRLPSAYQEVLLQLDSVKLPRMAVVWTHDAGNHCKPALVFKQAELM